MEVTGAAAPYAARAASRLLAPGQTSWRRKAHDRVTDLELNASAGEGLSSSAFHYRGFVLYWSARFLNAFSIQITSVAVGWQIYDQTRDPVPARPRRPRPVRAGARARARTPARPPTASIGGASWGSASRIESRLRDRAHGHYAARAGAPSGRSSPSSPYSALRARSLRPPCSRLPSILCRPWHFPNAVAWNSSSFQTAMIVGPGDRRPALRRLAARCPTVPPRSACLAAVRADVSHPETDAEDRPTARLDGQAARRLPLHLERARRPRRDLARSLRRAPRRRDRA